MSGPAGADPDGGHDVAVVENRSRQRFEIRVDGRLAGISTYRDAGGSTEIVHTEILPAYEHRGLGSRLIAGALDMVEGRGATVIPSCPFVQEYLRHHPERVDLVPPAERARFDLPSEHLA